MQEPLNVYQSEKSPDRYVLIVGGGAGFLDYYARTFQDLGFASLTVSSQ